MRRLMLAGALLVSVACDGGSGSVHATSPTPPSKPAGKANLIVNGDAESGKGSPVGGVVPVPGWETTGNFTVVEYSAADNSLMKATDAGPPDRGANYFAGGPSNRSSAAFQLIDVGSRAAAIDKGGVSFQLSGWLGSQQGEDDITLLTIAFVDKDGRLRGTVAIGPVTREQRQGQTALIQLSTSGNLPPLTRRIQVTLQMNRASAGYNHGYADSLSLTLS